MKRGREWPLLLIGVAVALAFAVAHGAGVLWRLDALMQDRFFHWRHVGPPPPVTLIEIDTPTLETLGWPIPRAHHANLLFYLARHRAQVVGYDVLLSERRGDVEDAALAAAASELPLCLTYAMPIAVDPAVAVAATVDSVVASQAYPMPPDASYRTAFAVEEVPYDELRDAARALGHATLLPERDGLVRSIPWCIELDGLAYPALSSQLFLLSHGAGREAVSLASDRVTVELPDEVLTIPLGSDGSMLVDWDESTARLPSFSMLEVLADDRRETEGLEPRIAGAVDGRVVLVGVTAEALRDSPPTPLGPKTAGGMIHAQALATMLSSSHLYPVSLWSVLAAGLVLSAGTAWLSGRLRSLRAGLAAAIVVAITGLAGWQLFILGRRVVPVASLMVAEAVAYAAASGYERFRREREGRQVKSVFGKYVSPAVLEELLERPEDALSLGGVRKDLSVVFCDVKGFSALCEQVDPPDLLRQLNDYFGGVTDVIFRFQGTVDKFMGDAVMAFFGHPLTQEGHARHAVRAALEMQRVMASLRRSWAADGKPPLHIRIGVHTGPALVGNMGSRRRLDYTVFGPTVNLAQRLEVSCDPDGVLVSEDVLRRVGGLVRVQKEKAVEAKNIGTVTAYQIAAMEES